MYAPSLMVWVTIPKINDCCNRSKGETCCNYGVQNTRPCLKWHQKIDGFSIIIVVNVRSSSFLLLSVFYLLSVFCLLLVWHDSFTTLWNFHTLFWVYCRKTHTPGGLYSEQMCIACGEHKMGRPPTDFIIRMTIDKILHKIWNKM